MRTTPPNLVLVPGTPAASPRTTREGHRPAIVHVAGAHRSLVKLAPVVAALEQRRVFRQVVVFTGQHSDMPASGGLDLPEVDRCLGVGPGGHGRRTARVLSALEPVLAVTEPEALVVAGDVSSALASALAAAKLGIAIAQLEAGLRSFDRSMPEELGRVLTDRLADTLFASGTVAAANLEAEGIAPGRIHTVGNPMIDALRRCEPAARALAAWRPAGVRERDYVLVTLQRAANVEHTARLAAIADGLVDLAGRAPVLFPIEAPARARLAQGGGLARLEAAGVRCLEPPGYLELLSLQAGAGAIVTDSGAVQEEASALGVSCFSFRPDTVRPMASTHGTNVLLGDDAGALAGVRPSPHSPTPCAIPLWDGRAGERVADVLVANYALTAGARDGGGAPAV